MTNQQYPQSHYLTGCPTGKAAARVSESISKALGKLNIADHIKQRIRKRPAPWHRLLVAAHDSRSYVHHRDNFPLVADSVIVGEAS